MFFTREPILETVISARDGFELVIVPVGNIKGETYRVKACEIVIVADVAYIRAVNLLDDFLVPCHMYGIREEQDRSKRISRERRSSSVTPISMDIAAVSEESIDITQLGKDEKADDAVLSPTSHQAVSEEEPSISTDSSSGSKGGRRTSSDRRKKNNWRKGSSRRRSAWKTKASSENESADPLENVGNEEENR